MKQNFNFIQSIRLSIRTDDDFCSNNAIRGILWNIGDHEGLAKFGSKRNKDNCLFDKNTIEIDGFDAIFCYDSADFSECVILQSYLIGNGYRVSIKKPTCSSNSLERLLLEKETKANCVILCLSENFIRSNSCRTELQLAFKKQLNIIPVIIHEHYKITCKWLDDIVTTMLDIIDLTKTSYKEAIRLLISTIQKSSNTCQEKRLHNSLTSIVYFPCDLYADCKDNNVEKIKEYIQHVPISQINHVESNGSTSLHVAAYYGFNELVKLLLKNGASRSIRNKHNLTAYEEARTSTIREIFKRFNDEDRFLSNIDINYEWILVCEETFLHREHFRQQLLKTFARDSTEDLSTKFDTVYDRIKEHYIILFEQENLPQRQQLLIDWFFMNASIEKNPIWIVKAYTSTTDFYKILNRHLAMYVLEYFHPTLNKSIDYKLVNCLIDFVGIFIHSDGLDKLNYVGQCYRGMLMTKDDISQYTIGSQVMNMTLLSTSKQKTIAEIYAGDGQSKLMRQTPDFKLIHFSTVCTYTVRNKHTALDIHQISEVTDEEEILILPFSTFRVTSMKRNDPKKNGILIELELEECCES
ncbi:unnamed protein product [Adineta steineri]|uniref:NAD(P)(+)--arginine ADP-ribosyltransferase n=1 Tax=Adineta steineri TaxID=433720 RepID=A0A814F486_9BILA|nr:unnamed protein product [Adineta steineri]CAF4123039.1 unnamed protein product [Adineta steineri]